jgi:bacteriocin-like protein
VNNGFEFDVTGIELSETELAQVQGGWPKWVKTVWKVTKTIAEGVVLIGGAIITGKKAADALGLTGNDPPPPPPTVGPVRTDNPNDPIFI